jgi:cytoskeletal protein CcmA (bactofilin family)
MGVLGERSAGPATLIAAQTTLQGDLQAEGSLHIDGTIKGNVRSAGDVSVGPEGRVEGDIRARNVRVQGRVDGQLVCGQVEISATGQVYGEVVTRALVISSGGRFVGKSGSMDSKSLMTVKDDSVIEDQTQVVSMNGVVAAQSLGSTKLARHGHGQQVQRH